MDELERRAAFTTNLAKGSVVMQPKLCADCLQLALLRSPMSVPYVARQVGIDRRTLTKYINSEVQIPWHRAIAVLEELGYEIVVRQKS